MQRALEYRFNIVKYDKKGLKLLALQIVLSEMEPGAQLQVYCFKWSTFEIVGSSSSSEKGPSSNSYTSFQ